MVMECFHPPKHVQSYLLKDRSLPRSLFRNMKYTNIGMSGNMWLGFFATRKRLQMPNKTPDHPFKIKDI